MLLNCDLGESLGGASAAADAAVMPYIDQASIACGFHAGDPLSMRSTLVLAQNHGVAIGAHPAYPDREGFGRRSVILERDELIASLHYQMAALDGMALNLGLTIQYVKPHGAMYHDMMARSEVRAAILQAMASYHRPLRLILQATTQADIHRTEAAAAGIQLLFEAFADRCYDDDGGLLRRDQPGAIHDREGILAQVAQLQKDNTVTTVTGKVIHLAVDTLCVHGDNPAAVQSIAAVRALLDAG